MGALGLGPGLTHRVVFSPLATLYPSSPHLITPHTPHSTPHTPHSTPHTPLSLPPTLQIADYTTSDPYVILSIGGDTHRTPTVRKSLNPTWHQATYHLVVHNLKLQSLRLTVMDSDFGIGSDDPLGYADVGLSSLRPDRVEERWVG